jgi:magnesium-transporting ATPase (P-type)
MDWHSMTVEEAFSALKTSRQGLNNGDITVRLKLYGRNKLTPPPKRGLLLRFFHQFHNILIYVLFASGVITVFLRHYIDASVIFGVIVINAIIGCIQEGKAEAAIESIKQMLSNTANVIRDGKRFTINAEELVPGDIVILQGGDKVPADLRLFELKNLQLQESILTGESNPIDKDIELVPVESSIANRTNMAFSGTLVTYGIGKGVVTETGEKAEIGKITAMLSKIKPVSTPLLKQMEVFSYWLTFVILGMSFFSFAVGVYFWHAPVEAMFMAAIGIAVAAIPEGLPPIITITLAIGVTKMAKRNAIVRRLPVVETMGAVSVICTDKTGTLTHNELTVEDVITATSTYHVTGSGYEPNGIIQYDSAEMPLQENSDLWRLLVAGILCNDSDINHIDNKWNLVGNPTDNAVLVLSEKAEIDIAKERLNYPRIDIIPFAAEHKFMVSLHHDHAGNGYIYLKGAPERIFMHCKWQLENGHKKAINLDYWNSQVNELASFGKRVVAVALLPVTAKHTVLRYSDVQDNLTILGIFGIIDPPREEAIFAVKECQQAGIQVKMITGDHAITARAIGEQVGIHDGHGVLIGTDLDNLTDEQLCHKVKEVAIFARTSPEHKLRLVRALQANGDIVAMTGEGVNDAPALRQAEIGIAMGKKGTEVAKEAAEMVLTDDNFNSIWQAIKEGRTIYDNIKKTILYLLPTNAVQAFSVMLAVLFGWLLPITPVQILWINMVTAVTLGISLSVEPAEDAILLRKPRDAHEPIMSKLLVWRTVFVSILILGGVFGMFLWERAHDSNLALARTVVINLLVGGQVAYLFNCRKLYGAVLSLKELLANKVVVLAALIMLLLQLGFTYLPVMQHFFGTASMSLRQWGIIALITVAIYLLVELEKAVMRKLIVNG